MTQASGRPAEEACRVRLGAGADTPGHVLLQLARDPSVTVRAAVAMNRGATPQADVVLTADGDERVRAFLAQKMARLLPGLPPTARDRAGQHVLSVLSALVEDAAIRVRAAIADEVKAMPHAPHALVLRLARDAAPPVSEPVIRLSPMLTDADLLSLLATPPHPLASHAVAARPNLSEAVADAIVARADTGTVRALLGNPSAAIREATLDALVAQAASHADWHAPLVRRPVLGAQAAHALCDVVARHLLQELAHRADLPPALADSLCARLASRHAHPAPCTDDDLMAAACRLHAAGALHEAALLDAAATGDTRRAMALLAVAAQATLAMLDHAVTRRSSRAVVALAWRAGFTMHAGAVMLASLGLPAVRPGPGGGFPLQPDEMAWQLEVLGRVNG